MSFEFNTKLSNIFANTREFATYLMQEHKAAKSLPKATQDAIDLLMLKFEKRIQTRAQNQLDAPNMTTALTTSINKMTNEEASALLYLADEAHKTPEQAIEETLETLKKQIINLNELELKNIDQPLMASSNFFKFLNIAAFLLPVLKPSTNEISEHKSEKLMELIPNFEAGLEYNFSIVKAYRERCPASLLHAKDAYYGYQNSTDTLKKMSYGFQFFLALVLEIPFTLAKNLLLDSLALLMNLTADILSLPVMALEVITLWSPSSVPLLKDTAPKQEAALEPTPLMSPKNFSENPAITPAFNTQVNSLPSRKPDLRVVIDDTMPSPPLKVSNF